MRAIFRLGRNESQPGLQLVEKLATPRFFCFFVCFVLFCLFFFYYIVKILPRRGLQVLSSYRFCRQASCCLEMDICIICDYLKTLYSHFVK